jgi:hypothetical protein
VEIICILVATTFRKASSDINPRILCYLTYVQNISPKSVENLRKHVRRERFPSLLFWYSGQKAQPKVSTPTQGLGYMSSAVRAVIVSLDPLRQTSGMKSVLAVQLCQLLSFYKLLQAYAALDKGISHSFTLACSSKDYALKIMNSLRDLKDWPFCKFTERLHHIRL